MRCRKCRTKAEVYLRSYNLPLCRQCYPYFFTSRVMNTIDKFAMCTFDERILVAVSGGKDSLALWDTLIKLGFTTQGVYIDLGISDYSSRSQQVAQEFADRKGVTLKVVSVKELLQENISQIARQLKQPACRLCGMIKRYIMNQQAQSFDVIATGHNLDDEASALLGNILNWQEGYLSRQYPVLSQQGNLTKKIKPLCFTLEQETAFYCFIEKIDYILDDCPLAKRATSLFYKDVLNTIEANMATTKVRFYKQFVKKKLFKNEQPQELAACTRCGFLTTSEVCSFCRVKEKLAQHTRAQQIYAN